MSLTLTVDGPRWRAHLESVADAHPGIVPVAKGNGYGFTLGRLARKAQWLRDGGHDVTTLAVGTYDEIPERRHPLGRRHPGADPVASVRRRDRARTGEPRDPHRQPARRPRAAAHPRPDLPDRPRAHHQHAAARHVRTRPVGGGRGAPPAPRQPPRRRRAAPAARPGQPPRRGRPAAQRLRRRRSAGPRRQRGLGQPPDRQRAHDAAPAVRRLLASVPASAPSCGSATAAPSR